MIVDTTLTTIERYIILSFEVQNFKEATPIHISNCMEELELSSMEQKLGGLFSRENEICKSAGREDETFDE